VLDDLLQHRSVVKMDSTYAVGMLKHIRDDGRIHPSLLLDGARSGRASCQDPNLQNIPREADSAEGKMARDVFVAAPGHVLMSVDYSQIELRIAAMLSGDQEMQQIFQDGVDFHRRTAELISKIAWKIRPQDVEKKHRTAAKSVNFGVLYGLGDDGLAAQLGCSVNEARRVREAVLGRFHRLAKWIRERLIEAKKTGYCRTWWAGAPARRRSLWRLASKDSEERSRNEHAAHNTPIQGTASEFCLASLVAVVRWIRADAVPAKLILPIHDALLLEVHEDCVQEVAQNVREIMLSWNSMGVPLEVDIDTGLAWGSLVRMPMTSAVAPATAQV
jgi:DNA polymerase-1